MPTFRLPVSATSSLGLHLGLALLYLHLVHLSAEQHKRILNNVDFKKIIIHKVQAPVVKPTVVEKPKPPKLMEFLKLALPSIPKPAIQEMKINLPDVKKPLQLAQVKLEDKGRLEQMKKVEALDLNSKRNELAQLNVEAKDSSRKIAALAAAPMLEDVGTHRVRNLPQALALEQRRREAVVMQTLDKAIPTARERSTAAQMTPAALQDAAQAVESRSRLLSKIASMLPTQEVNMAPRLEELRRASSESSEAIKKKLDSFTPPPLAQKRQEELKPEEKKKSVEIEGPLADRKIVAYDIPQFPDWAKQQGVIEAEVAIRFWVSPAGDVLSDMQVARLSGYGQLDRLAMESLKKWKFLPLATSERQWGIITFRFILE